MTNAKYDDWALQVVRALEAGNKSDYHEALNSCSNETGEKPPAAAGESLSWMRGDEPQEAFDHGDPAQEYADFLLCEWDLYGPEGE